LLATHTLRKAITMPRLWAFCEVRSERCICIEMS
jgi:hypothetical protein